MPLVALATADRRRWPAAIAQAATGVDFGARNAVTTIDDSLQAEVGVAASHAMTSIAAYAAVLGGLYLVTALLVIRSAPGRRARVLAGALIAYFAALAVALSVLGIDHRRWWSLALLGLLATWTVAQRDRPRRRADVPAPPAVLHGVAILLLVLAAPLMLLPVYPVT